MAFLGDMSARNKVIGAVAVLIIIASLVWMFFSLPSRPSYGQRPTKAYFTVDDGATLFEDDFGKVAPFTHEGKEAVRAHVYSNDGGATKKVLALSMYSPEAKKQKEAMAQGDPNATDEPDPLFRKPGPQQPWVDPRYVQAYQALQNPASLGEYQGWVEIWPK